MFHRKFLLSLFNRKKNANFISSCKIWILRNHLGSVHKYRPINLKNLFIFNFYDVFSWWFLIAKNFFLFLNSASSVQIGVWLISKKKHRILTELKMEMKNRNRNRKIKDEEIYDTEVSMYWSLLLITYQNDGINGCSLTLWRVSKWMVVSFQ